MNNMEIKQGDTVRVSKDAPRELICGSDYLYTEIFSEVIAVAKGVANIKMEIHGTTKFTYIPTKYLVKVDAEAKEAKPMYKIGTDVCISNSALSKVYTIIQTTFIHNSGWIYELNTHEWYVESSLRPYTEPTTPKVKVGDRVRNVKSDLCGIALKIEHGIVEVGIPYDKEKHYWNTDIVELFEPTEQTEAEKKPNVGSIKIPVEVDLKEVAKEYAEAMSNAIREYGDALCKHGTFIRMVDDLYKRDLAKEVALKVANKYNDPKEAAEYAVLVAKSVAEGLKRE